MLKPGARSFTGYSRRVAGTQVLDSSRSASWGHQQGAVSEVQLLEFSTGLQRVWWLNLPLPLT